VRLRKGFVNLEKAPFGGEKLRIPMLLFVEKMRTQSRFNVRASLCLSIILYPLTALLGQRAHAIA
jgi:hypothetical protein